ncbi:deoxyribonuclease V [Marinihelvus fidelis]|uniref:Endonuclease V n=1 Tax=Marinihelvus fidelis TaxID=2613842 RepID=A0A5N0T7T1_9GAMM|nr:deoxyribonuclease V [Marinihelvus fidelis]KAA9130831.1 deoxyribonuclease V [Marinihelvus fidelis]
MPRALHRWDLDIAEARTVQTRLAARVETHDRLGQVRAIAGVDCGFEDDGRLTRAAVVVMRWPGLDVIESTLARVPTTFPYIPGYLSFREMPAILAAFKQLETRPDLLLCDGQGIAHPRRLGIACHLGLWLDRPAVGVGKSRLVGAFEPPGEEKGSSTPLVVHDETIGAVLRTRDRVRPLFVSPGHRIGVDSAARWVLDCAIRYRLPEPVHAADRLASSKSCGRN